MVMPTQVRQIRRKEATFELNENSNKKTFKLVKGESLSKNAVRSMI